MSHNIHKLSGFTFVEFAIVLAILALFLGAFDNPLLALLRTFVAILIAVWCCAIWLVREGGFVFKAGISPAPRSSRLFARGKVITGARAKRHALIAMSIGVALALLLPGFILWLVRRAS
jgi:hypothetical protein